MREYTSKRRASAYPFKLDGVEFNLPGKVMLLELYELQKLADKDTDSPEGKVAIGRFFREAFGEGPEYDRFLAHCRQHETDNDTLLDIIRDMVRGDSGFPTQQLSDSSSGTTDTPPTLRVISQSGDMRTEELTPERRAQLDAAVAKAQAEWAERRQKTG